MKKASSKVQTKKLPNRVTRSERFAAGVERGMQIAAKSARKIARMYGTPLFVLERGKNMRRKNPSDDSSVNDSSVEYQINDQILQV
jgi:hypothetical protein